MKFFILLPLIAMLFLDGCNEVDLAISAEHKTGNTGSSLPHQHTLNSHNHQYQLQVLPPKQGIPVNTYFDLAVTVNNSVGQPLAYPVELEFEAGMKAHSHGMNTLPRIEPLNNGRFRIKQLLFHMPGEWNLEFRVMRGVVSDYATLDVEVWP